MPLPITLAPCPKGSTFGLDKAVPPKTTLKNVMARLNALEGQILAGTKRVDVGRLGIPVYLSLCGPYALELLPTHKQMGNYAAF
ncbi:MAG: hypothetical protein IJU79_04645 [Desulfovibrionaceae bacterium]|nr:hypothetical protein [Desulfovibrionaceae bacterium]